MAPTMLPLTFTIYLHTRTEWRAQHMAPTRPTDPAPPTPNDKHHLFLSSAFSACRARARHCALTHMAALADAQDDYLFFHEHILVKLHAFANGYGKVLATEGGLRNRPSPLKTSPSTHQPTSFVVQEHQI